MSSNHPAIRVSHLSKQYKLGGPQEPYHTLRDAIVNSLKAPLKVFHKAPPVEGFWALKDVSFEVEPGEVVGIIGRNGAGKSTLLKILSRITSPTEGTVELHGRVGSLLEVGTGFHPELTGRENIYLSGSILGMKRREIDAKLDDIVKFSEIEKFLDTPVKRYSSGMYVRLAFAVAAHLEPEILLVDEVLAVGDAAFQKKCLGKMGEVAKEGRTVLFVSHQMNTIRKLCPRCLWFHDGELKLDAPTVKVISTYENESLQSVQHLSEIKIKKQVKARFISWEIVHPKTLEKNWINTFGEIEFKITLNINEFVQKAHHGLSIYDQNNRLIYGWATDNLDLNKGCKEFHYKLPYLPIRPDTYYIHVSLYEGEKLLDEWNCSPGLSIVTPPVTHPRDEWAGILNIPCNFHIEEGVSEK